LATSPSPPSSLAPLASSPPPSPSSSLAPLVTAAVRRRLRTGPLDRGPVSIRKWL
jgi:hypothetical protein